MEEEIHKKMVNWFIKMGADCSVPLNNIEQECKMLCPPQMKDVWSYITYHVRPVSEIKHIEKVLLLHHLEKNKVYARKKLKVRISSIKELEFLQKRELLYLKLSRCKKEIFEKKAAIQTKLMSLSERVATVEDLKQKRKNEYRISAMLNLKKQTEYERLFKIIEFADSMKAVINSLRKATSSEQDAFADMHVNDCLEQFNLFITSQFSSEGATLTGLEKLWKNFLVLNNPLKLMNYIIMEKLQSSSLNVARLTDSDDVWRSFRNIGHTRLKYEKYLQTVIEEAKDEVGRSYMENKKLEEDIKTDVIQIKSYKHKLFATLVEKSKQHYSAGEVITKDQFEAWFISEIKCIDLERRKKIMQYKSQAGDSLRTEDNLVISMETALKEYKKEIDNWNQRMLNLKIQISSCMEDWKNERMRQHLNRFQQELIATIKPLRNLNVPKQAPVTDVMQKEFDLIESIPFHVLTSDPEQELAYRFSYPMLLEIANICCWLWMLKHQNYTTFNSIQPSFNSDTIKNRINEISREEAKYAKEIQHFVQEIKERLADNKAQVEDCERLLNLWKSLSKYGEYIPNCIFHDGDSFSTWFNKFKEKIQNLKSNKL